MKAADLRLSENPARSGEQTHPVGADISLKIRKAATRGSSRFLIATSHPKGFGQFSDATSDLPSISEVDADLEGCTAIGNFGLPLSQASVGDRQATQQLSFSDGLIAS